MIFGTGELYLDCIMHDLRKMYSEIGVCVCVCVCVCVNTYVSACSIAHTCIHVQEYVCTAALFLRW